MKTNHKLALAALAGVSIGLAAAQVIHAQQVKTPPAYVIAEVEKDPAKIADAAARRFRLPDHRYSMNGVLHRSLVREQPALALQTAAVAGQ